MSQVLHFLIFLTAFSPFALCFGTFQEDPLPDFQYQIYGPATREPESESSFYTTANHHATNPRFETSSPRWNTNFHYHNHHNHQIHGGYDPRASNGHESLYSSRHRHVNHRFGRRTSRWSTDFYSSGTRLDQRSRNSASPKVVNVDDFGARGNGGDDSKAFELAWKEACSSREAILLVPKGRTYTLKPITFSGPCRSALTLEIYGKIEASPRLSDYDDDRRHWLQFEGISDLVVQGTGIIDGNGREWWQRSCKVNKDLPCKEAPTAVTFFQCTNLVVTDLTFRNAQKMHIWFQKCQNVKALNLRVVAPENSPNTDGIHVSETQNVIIRNCIIGTGDDCISIVSGSRYVRAFDITCGPGHGISIGSLGAENSEAEVSNVRINGARISGTSNGVRIKTWQGGSGYARNILFQNVVMNNVTNPIIIDQNYCDKQGSCPEQTSAVQISNVVYENIRGTSASEDAIKFDCSKSFPCQGISLLGVNLVGQRDEVVASCENVSLKQRWRVKPHC